jgi:TRAP-type C4-dicarboxylate transport system permease small subunit
VKEKVFEKVTQYIDALAAKLGVAAEHVYGVLVRQQVADGVVGLSIFAFLLVLLVISIYLAIKFISKSENGEDVEGFIAGAFGFAAIIIGAIVLIQVIFFVPSDIKQLINPEYYAIREILDAIK